MREKEVVPQHTAEAFLQPKMQLCSKYRSAAGRRLDPLGELTSYNALPDPLAGLRGHLVYDILALPSQSVVKIWLQKSN